MIIANMATFPARSGILPDTLNRILPQVDKINLCLNGYDDIPECLKKTKINAFIPDRDYRDVGKFAINNFADEDDIFYMDDDILYPEDYVERMISVRCEYSEINPVLGLHGVIYPDAYDGTVKSRIVFAFRKALEGPRVVNQLGTGTIYCKGFQAATLSFMKGSERFVDVRFAIHALNNSWPMVCVCRKDEWLSEVTQNQTIFSTFTSSWPLGVVKESQAISGYHLLDHSIVLAVENS